MRNHGTRWFCACTCEHTPCSSTWSFMNAILAVLRTVCDNLQRARQLPMPRKPATWPEVKADGSEGRVMSVLRVQPASLVHTFLHPVLSPAELLTCRSLSARASSVEGTLTANNLPHLFSCVSKNGLHHQQDSDPKKRVRP